MNLSQLNSDHILDECDKDDLTNFYKLFSNINTFNSPLLILRAIFLRAVKYGNLKIIKFLVGKKCIDLDDCLYFAVVYNKFTIVKFLSESGADAMNYHHFSIQIASTMKNTKILKYFISKIDARKYEYEYEQCVSYAYHKGLLKNVKMLVEAGAPLTQSILSCSCKVGLKCENINNYFPIIHYFIEKGLVVNNVNYFHYPQYQEQFKTIFAKKIYFWWIQTCYNVNNICGQRSMYKNYNEYKKMMEK